MDVEEDAKTWMELLELFCMSSVDIQSFKPVQKCIQHNCFVDFLSNAKLS